MEEDLHGGREARHAVSSEVTPREHLRRAVDGSRIKTERGGHESPVEADEL